MPLRFDSFLAGSGGGIPPPSDPDFASVQLLLSFDGSDAATTTSDESDNAATLTSFAADAQLDTAQKKWGSASLLLDGAGDAVLWADDADFNIGAGQFTIEAWVRYAVAAAGTQRSFASHWGPVQRSWLLGTEFTDNAKLNFLTSLNGSAVQATIASAALTWNVGQWYHVAADRDGADVMRIYRDGTFLAKSTEANTLHNSTSTLDIGSHSGGTALNFDGHIDDVRFTVGVARYASDSGYTVPTAAFPRF